MQPTGLKMSKSSLSRRSWVEGRQKQFEIVETMQACMLLAFAIFCHCCVMIVSINATVLSQYKIMLLKVGKFWHFPSFQVNSCPVTTPSLFALSAIICCRQKSDTCPVNRSTAVQLPSIFTQVEGCFAIDGSAVIVQEGPLFFPCICTCTCSCTCICFALDGAAVIVQRS